MVVVIASSGHLLVLGFTVIGHHMAKTNKTWPFSVSGNRSHAPAAMCNWESDAPTDLVRCSAHHLYTLNYKVARVYRENNNAAANEGGGGTGRVSLADRQLLRLSVSFSAKYVTVSRSIQSPIEMRVKCATLP